MPTVLRVNGYRFYFYASDRKEPCHVHVSKGDGVGKVWLEPEVQNQYLDFFSNKRKTAGHGNHKGTRNVIKRKVEWILWKIDTTR